MDPWSAAISFGESMYNNWAADERQDDAQNFSQGESTAQRFFNAEEAAKSREFNSAQALAQRNWQEQMSNTAVRRHAADLSAAGFNPLLSIAPSGGATTPSGAHATSAAASSGIGSAGIASPAHGGTIMAGLQSASQINVNEALADRTKAEAEKIRLETKDKIPAEVSEIRARIPVHQEQVNNLKQQIGESAVRIEKIWEEVSQVKATAANLSQQTQNLQAALPLIKAQIAQLKALAAKESAETNEIKQRITADLPGLERTLGNIETLQHQMSMPAHGNKERAADSLAGQIGAYLREINPLQGFIGITPGRRSSTHIHNYGGRK